MTDEQRKRTKQIADHLADSYDELELRTAQQYLERTRNMYSGEQRYALYAADGSLDRFLVLPYPPPPVVCVPTPLPVEYTANGIVKTRYFSCYRTNENGFAYREERSA